MSLRIAILCLFVFAVSCQLQILTPPSLKTYWNKEKPKAAIANFGYVPWGRRLTGTVFKANPYKACSPLEPFPIDKEKAENPDTYPIVLAERGGCTFAQKAQHAQLAGARMLIIVDNLDESAEQTMPVGDGQDGSVHIPTIMIGGRAGAKLREYLDQPEETRELISIAMNFEMPKNQGSKVKIELWLSGLDERSFDLVKNLKEYIDKFNPDTVAVTPYYAIWYCPYCRETNYTTDENMNCLSGGRYCAPDPDESGPLNGRDILYEDLRQLCIHTLSTKSWFDYMAHFDTKCPLAKGRMEKCHLRALEHTDIEEKTLEGCIQSTFDGSNHNLTDNWLLKKQRVTFKRRGIQVWPSVVINGFLYKGNVLPVTNVYEAICEAFDTMPTHCIEYFSRKKSDTVFEEADDLDLMSIVVWIGVIGIFVLLGALFFYRRWIRRELMRDLNNQVSAKISEYMSMQDDERGQRGIIKGTED